MPEISTVRPISVHRRWWEPRDGGPVLDHLEVYAKTQKVLEIAYSNKTRFHSVSNWDALIVTFNGIGDPNREYYWFPWPYRSQGKDAVIDSLRPDPNWSGSAEHIKEETKRLLEHDFQPAQLWKRVTRVEIGMSQAERGLTRVEKRRLIEYATLSDMPEGMFDALWKIRCVLRT